MHLSIWWQRTPCVRTFRAKITREGLVRFMEGVRVVVADIDPSIQAAIVEETKRCE